MASRTLNYDFDAKIIELQEARNNTLLKVLGVVCVGAITIPLEMYLETSYIYPTILVLILTSAYFWNRYEQLNTKISQLKELDKKVS